jgi:hypothetical protein
LDGPPVRFGRGRIDRSVTGLVWPWVFTVEFEEHRHLRQTTLNLEVRHLPRFGATKAKMPPARMDSERP